MKRLNISHVILHSLTALAAFAGGLKRNELLRLTEQVKELDVKRVEYLADLARLRETNLPDLMKDLGSRSNMFGRAAP